MKPSGQALVPAIADWLYWRLIKDSQQAGVMFSPQLRCFVTGGKVDKVEAGRGDSAPRRSQPSDLQQWSSVEELKALIQVRACWHHWPASYCAVMVQFCDGAVL